MNERSYQDEVIFAQSSSKYYILARESIEDFLQTQGVRTQLIEPAGPNAWWISLSISNREPYDAKMNKYKHAITVLKMQFEKFGVNIELLV